jgi:hypothetical protein
MELKHFSTYCWNFTTLSFVHNSLIIVSNSLNHTTTVVHLFQCWSIKFIKDQVGSATVSNVVYFSDGSRVQCTIRKSYLSLDIYTEELEPMQNDIFSGPSVEKMHVMSILIEDCVR